MPLQVRNADISRFSEVACALQFLEMATTKTELLIHGYIRKIRLLLSEEIIIPADKILLCLLFWKEALNFITIDQNNKSINFFKDSF